MEFLRRILSQIKSQLGGLNTSQRLVIVLLLVIMTGAILMMVNFVADRERVALLNQSFDQESLQRIVHQLDMWQEDYHVEGDRIWVAKSAHKRLIAKLGYAEALPQDTSAGWSILLEDSDIWVPESVRLNKKRIALQVELASAISTWPGVHKVRIFINEGDKRRLNNQLPRASASVAIETSSQTNTRKMAVAVAEFVSAANNRMQRENVTVNIDGKNVPVVSEEDQYDSDYIAEKMKYEQLYANKIKGILPPGLDAIVQVDVKWKNVKSQIHSTEYSQDGEGSLIATIEEEGRSDESYNQDASQEPGLIANAGDSGSRGGNSQNNTTDETMVRKKAFPGLVDKVEEIGMGGVKDVTASVMIPDNYFKEMAKNGSDEEPDAATVQAVIDQELAKFKEAIVRVVNTATEQVFVSTYWAGGVMASSDGAPGAGQEAETRSITDMAVRYGKHIAVAALAMISLVMVLMMVRKSIGPVEVSDEEAIAMMAGNKPLDALGLEDSNLDDGEEGDALLSGMEMDEDTIRSQQVLQQIREMVEDMPDDATNLVSKWINQVN